MSRLIRILPALALLLPGAALAAPRNFVELASLVVQILNNATAVLIVAGLVIYFFGISTNILKTGESDREKLRGYLVWGVIVLFVMVSIWGILRLLQDTLFGTDTSNPAPGSSTSADLQFQAPTFTE